MRVEKTPQQPTTLAGPELSTARPTPTKSLIDDDSALDTVSLSTQNKGEDEGVNNQPKRAKGLKNFFKKLGTRIKEVFEPVLKFFDELWNGTEGTKRYGEDDWIEVNN